MPKKKNEKDRSENARSELRKRVAKAPQKPGVYRWLGKGGEVLYVGKAKNLRSRIRSYVQKKPDNSMGPWKMALIAKIADIDWTITETEIEALILETNLIKEIKPKYNVLMKDGKNYVYVKITVKDPYPTVSVMRNIENDGAKYYGPFLSAGHIHRTLEMLHEVYGWRSCQRSIDLLNKAQNASTHSSTRGTEASLRSASSHRSLRMAQHDIVKPCLDSQIGKCNGICKGQITNEEYRLRIDEMQRFFRGDRIGVIEKLRERMAKSAEKKLFEQAAKLRDTLHYIESLEAQQIVSDTSGENTDAIGVALLKDRAHVVILMERGGKVIGERSATLSGNADSIRDVLTQFIPQYYSSIEDIPDTLLMREEPEDKDMIEKWLNEKRLPVEALPAQRAGAAQSGKTNKRITIRIPERGKKAQILDMAEMNAEEKIEQHLARWEAATKDVEDALSELQKELNLNAQPKRIECYDISHLGGTETVGSMVVFIDGRSRNDQYRSFTIRTMKRGEIDDYKALREVLTRRLRYLQHPEKEWNKRGVFFEKAKKADVSTIEAILIKNEQVFKGPFDAREFIIARKEKDIIGFGRLVTPKRNVHCIQSIWVDDRLRGNKLGHILLQKLIMRAKKGKVYITIHPHLEDYYTQAGFRHMHAPPSFIKEEIEKARIADPNFPEEGRIAMIYVVVDHRPDVSLHASPDLIVLDGGKGQLGVGMEVLEAMNFNMPIIAIAKREEEIFAFPNPNPNPKPKPNQIHIPNAARFLIMRLRDEAHRFANSHRKKRAKRAMLQ